MNGRSLRASFSLALLALSVAITLATAGAFLATVAGISSQYTQRFANSQNELEKNRILSLVDRELALSLKLVDDPVVQAWMVDETNPGLSQAAQKQLASYGRLFRDNTWFVAVGRTGAYYVQSGLHTPLETTYLTRDKASDRWFFDSLSMEKPYWINVNYDALLDEVRVWINTRVTDPEGRVLGVAGTGLDLGDFLTRLVDHTDPGLWSIIVNARGEILAHPDRSLTESNARVTRDEDRVHLDQLFPAPGDQAKLQAMLGDTREWGGRATQSASLSYQGTPVVAVVGYLPDLDWYNLVLVDGSRIIGWTSFLPIGLVFLTSLVLIVVTVRWLLHSVVLGPLATLNQASDTVASGAWQVRLEITSDNELGRLGTSFNQMAAKIQDYTENLENLVTERTRALRESQARLVDSIAYGQLIQASILPSAQDLAAYTDSSFLILRPLDTVGGDFCFFRPIPGGFCVAAVDCTGHGVPGAFMTMMVNALLHQVIEESSGEGAGALLERLDRLVQDTLRVGTGKHVQNGLDIGLCLVHHDRGEVEFAGAGLPLLVAAARVWVVPGTHTHLGFSSPRKKQPITETRWKLEAGQRYYLFTDGVLDLPGGGRGFGLGREGLMALVASVQHLPLADQEEALGAALAAHQGSWPAKDDLLLFGFETESGEVS